MQELVSISRDGDIAIITIDNPPVNALSRAVRQALQHAVRQLDNDPRTRGIVIACRGRTFFAGVDISEFDQPTLAPGLGELIAAIDAAATPIAAAMHGTILGGGLELALACRLRVLEAAAVVGFPEIKLGLIPGAGGTVRLPRLVGCDYALDVIASGIAIRAAEARARGIVHELADGDVLSHTIARLRALLEANAMPPRVRDLAVSPGDAPALAARIIELEGRTANRAALASTITAVRNAGELLFDDAVEAERRLFALLRSSASARAQRHLFFAERQAARLPDMDRAQRKTRDLRRVGVVGAGTLGSGIAASFALAGIPVVVREISAAALAAGRDRAAGAIRGAARRERMTAAEADERQALISGTVDLSELAACDLVVEAAFEDIEVKRGLFSDLDALLKPGAILASNTSYLDIDALAAATSRPDDVAGMHFFSPAHIMRLVEIVRGSRTAPEALATLGSVTRRMGKVPVFVGTCHGFVGNRMLNSRNAQIPDLLLEGALPQQIDAAFRAFGWPMGPLQMWDMAGLDIAWRNRKFLGTPEPIGDSLCAQGRFGQKVGLGYYRYAGTSREPVADEEVAALIERLSRDAGIVRRFIADDEIIERTHFPMLNEACRILDDGIAARPSDIDVIWTNGYGFPRDLGGPMYWAEQLGWQHVAARLANWRGRTRSEVFRPAARLMTASSS
jgi:3-hydroxyacyl-CoA dehydrogenase